MKQVFEPLTHLLPDNFPRGRPSLIPVETEGKQNRRKTTSSENEAEASARAIVDLAILRMAETSRTPLFVWSCWLWDDKTEKPYRCPVDPVSESHLTRSDGSSAQHFHRIFCQTNTVIPFFTNVFRDAKPSMDSAPLIEAANSPQFSHNSDINFSFSLHKSAVVETLNAWFLG
ncbi:hypothetical protein BLNAU_10097 [Blattamonas nauphoetae]|uniref:Uncharacterized protein n=1 Tax=Blattamonas nauphoetae TaxID=2049346 RepID=A0ABQ9XU00_9EUKA|nr:hypothetical protein BLNAU_10097 [Blattamonas nauphoetae]